MFTPGHPNYKKKGTKHKFKLPSVHETLHKHNINPIDYLVTILPLCDVAQKIDVMKFLTNYAWSKPIAKPEEELLTESEETDTSTLSDEEILNRCKPETTKSLN